MHIYFYKKIVGDPKVTCRIVKTDCLDWQLTATGEHGHHGVVAVAHVVVATDPATESATHPYRPMEAPIVVDLPLTHSHVTQQSAQVRKLSY